MRLPDTSFWQGKRVFLTGHSGFKGSWLTIWLHRLGARVRGVSLPPETEPNLFTLADISKACDSHFCDIRNGEELGALVRQFEPEIVFHLAAQPLVRASYRDPVLTFETNITGTAHVLEALRGIDSVRVVVMVTTDKVYRNLEHGEPYREDDQLGGHDPYSASKAASELVIDSYRESFLASQGVAVSTARAGNVIGGGDWSKDRLIPDTVRAWQADHVLEVRRPGAVRPWQHVLEPLAGYIALAEHLWRKPEDAGPYNFGPEAGGAASVHEVVELARRSFGAGQASYAAIEDGPHEAGLLSLDPAKAKKVLQVEPRWELGETVSRTLRWYRSQLEGANAEKLCLEDIKAYGDGG